MKRTCTLIALAAVSTPALAQISYGGYTFDNDAFADVAVANETGS